MQRKEEKEKRARCSAEGRGRRKEGRRARHGRRSKGDRGLKTITAVVTVIVDGEETVRTKNKHQRVSKGLCLLVYLLFVSSMDGRVAVGVVVSMGFYSIRR